jgi:hypothetical protein
MDLLFNWPGRSEAVDSMFLMESPIIIVTISLVYFYFVKYYGPRMMENKKPKKIRRLVIFYNIFQLMSCFLMIFWVITPVEILLINKSDSNILLACRFTPMISISDNFGSV